MRFRSPTNIQLRRAQLVLILAAVVPTILMTATGIILLVVGQGSIAIVAGILVLAFCTSSLTGYLLGSIFVSRGASLARVQNDFLSSVSHEFRTPITSIRMFIETLRDGRVTDPVEQQRCLRIVGQEMERLDGLVTKLLDLSRIEAGKQPFERVPVPVADLVKDAITALDAVRMGDELKLEVEVHPDLEVMGDRLALGQVFVNLLVNAWKYTPKENKCITFRVYPHKKYVVFDVEDNGGHTLSSNTTQLNPIEDSPTANWNIHNTSLLLDNADSGFTMAIGGVVATVDNTYIQAHGTSSMGAVNVKGIGINIGNGTDPIDFGGINFFYAQGQINSGVNVTGQISGFGFQIQTLSGATLAPGASIRAFYDNADINGATHGYQSFQASPNIDSIANNSNYAGLDLNPTIPVFTGNANFNGVSVAGTLGTFGTGSFNGVNINPNITLVNYAVGINVTMDNVIVVVGVSATSVIQDLTVSFNEKSSFNNRCINGNWKIG